MQPIDRPSEETDKRARECIGYIRGSSLIQIRVLVSPKSKSTDVAEYSLDRTEQCSHEEKMLFLVDRLKIDFDFGKEPVA